VVLSPDRKPRKALSDASLERARGRSRKPGFGPADGWRAACMSDEEWAHWIEFNPRNLGGLGNIDRPCGDCPSRFAEEMRAVERCNGTPGVAETGGPPSRRVYDERDGVVTDRPTPVAMRSTKPGRAPAAPEVRFPSDRYPLPRDRAERDAAVFAALRSTPTLGLASQRLKVSETRVGQILRQIREDGGLPEDISLLLQMRRGVPHLEPKPHPGWPASKRAHIVSTEPPPAEPGIGAAYSAPDSPPEPVAIETVEPPDPPQPSPAVLLPCEGCIHAVVCSIKPELERWAETLVAPVSPLAAITVGAISVSCRYERAEA
jgi:hypothetical protein